MSVYKKLQEARIKLQNTKLSKSGLNKFAGFQYFELADFLPEVQAIFSELGLSSSITFTSDVATLTIIDVSAPHNISTPASVFFTCPVIVPTMKGCNEIQALGAMMTYIRRYLYVNALEIVEHDAIDATSGKEKGVVHRPVDNPSYNPEGEELEFITGVVDTLLGLDTDYEAMNAYLHSQNLDADQKTFVWSKLDSKARSAIKKLNSKE